jgi:predicted  nucleic acid-binding Zn-ribbon protein
MSIKVEVSLGEFLDKLTILEIKSERIQDPAKLANVRRQLDRLREAWRASNHETGSVSGALQDLKRVNEELWDIENRIRAKESEGAFDEEFIELARAVYRTNDRRAAISQELNRVLGSELMDEKSYQVRETR